MKEEEVSGQGEQAGSQEMRKRKMDEKKIQERMGKKLE